MRPICINHGCGKPAAHDGRRWRIHCGHCQGASYGKHPHAPGVTPFKKGVCANHDGHLGFSCVSDLSKAPEWVKGLTEVDHVDGDYLNNAVSNLKELCVMCHKIKGQVNGDYNGTRKKNQTLKAPISKNIPTKASYEAFDRLFGT